MERFKRKIKYSFKRSDYSNLNSNSSSHLSVCDKSSYPSGLENVQGPVPVQISSLYYGQKGKVGGPFASFRHFSQKRSKNKSKIEPSSSYSQRGEQKGAEGTRFTSCSPFSLKSKKENQKINTVFDRNSRFASLKHFSLKRKKEKQNLDFVPIVQNILGKTLVQSSW